MGEVKRSPTALAIYHSQEPFLKINRQLQKADRLIFEREAAFALQIVKGNDALKDAAPESLTHAKIQVASMGLTLNPTESLCYLLPYGKQCYPSPSYRGLVNLALRHKSVQWVQADVVYEKDVFHYSLGTECKVEHKPSMQKDRGKRICAYVVWRTGSGDLRADIVTDEELLKMEEAATRKNKGKQTAAYRWWRDEMAKKSAIRRSSKLWNKSASMSAAIGIMDTYESGVTVEGKAEAVALVTEKQIDELNAEIKTPATLTKLLSAYGISKLTELNADDFDEALMRVRNAEEMAKAKKAKR